MKLLALFLLATATTNAQFTCTFAASDENSCLSQTDDSGGSCVWCALSGFAFCVGEEQAEAMEQSLPGIDCDRNAPSTDDDAVPTDDALPPATDDAVAPTDDAIPDNYWECLQQKDATSCAADEGCTWCNTKAGFGLCMTGPTAESAADSDWFDCKADTELEDPYDTACVLAFLQDPTEQGCKTAVDQDGKACEWCDMQGMTNLCLNDDQAQEAGAIGVTCDASAGLEDPYDTACALAFLQDPTEEGCKAALDQDDKACEWCELQGMGNICLNDDQAQAAGAIGVTCDASQKRTTLLRGA